jgi:enamine deaminase RidA (YjgF/YER057c/UK114 family)
MPLPLDRRALLKSLGSVAIAAAAGRPAGAALVRQGPAPRVPARAPFTRVSLAGGIILHAGETSMELYHRHPHDPKEEIVQPEDIRLQTRLTMRNHKEVLDWMDLGWDDVVKLTCYQKRMDESPQIEEVLRSYFKRGLPPMSVYQIDGLSSPQARIEIDMWVRPKPTTPSGMKAPVPGIFTIFPRPEVTGRVAYAPGIKLPADMDLLFFSGLTAYPWEVDPFRPGSFQLPSDAAERSRLAAVNVQQVLESAGITWQHIVNNVNYSAPGGGAVNFREHWGDYSPCSTSLRVTNVGIPGVNVLNELNAAAPRKQMAATPGVMRGIEPVLHRSGVALRDLPAAPAVRVGSTVDLVFFAGVHGATEAAAADAAERQLKAAGLGWNNVVQMLITGESVDGAAVRSRLGEWRPARTVRRVPTGIPGADVLLEITAAAPRA